MDHYRRLKHFFLNMFLNLQNGKLTTLMASPTDPAEKQNEINGSTQMKCYLLRANSQYHLKDVSSDHINATKSHTIKVASFIKITGKKIVAQGLFTL